MNKKRTVSSFQEVASDINIKNNDNSDDLLNSVLKDKKPKEKTHIFKGYYLEREVANEIDRITDGKPKGTKSEFINAVIKSYLISEGYIK